MRRGKVIAAIQWALVSFILLTTVLRAAAPGHSSTFRRIKYVNGEKIVVDEMRLDNLKPDEMFSPYPGVRVTLLSEAEAAKRLGRGAPRPKLTDGWISEFYTDFESGDWDANLIKRTLSGGYTWGRVRYNPYQGTYCCWCADKESQGYPELDPETEEYGPDMDAWLEYENFDTRDCDNGTLSFALWYHTQDVVDYVNVLFSVWWEGYEWYGNGPGWELWEFDIDEWGPSYRNMLGFADLRLVFKFASNGSVQQRGAFLDNIDLRKRLEGGGAPDLTVTELSGTPASLDQGDLLTIDASVKNQGEARSGETNVRFYLSGDATITPSDYLLGQYPLFALDPDVSQHYNEMVNIPTNIPDGSYYLGAVADEADNVSEDDETNNTGVTGSAAITLGGANGAPDLVIGNVVLNPSAGQAGTSTEVSFELRNIGSAAAGAPHNVRIYWSADNTAGPGDGEMATVAVYDIIPAGGVQNISRNVNILQGTPAGNYYVVVVADVDNNVIESDENNNAASASFVVQGTGVETAAGAVPSEYFLSDNYPNPFNPSTTIAFGLPQNGPALLRVFDASGRLIRTLVRQDLNAGAYRIVWDSRDESGSAVPSGVYLYDLRAGDFHRAAKMVLMD